MLTAETIAKLHELLAKATRGPWAFSKSKKLLSQWGVGLDLYVGALHDGDQVIAVFAHDGMDPSEAKANAELVRTLINALPTLLADYERLRGMEERVNGAPTAVAVYRSSTFLTNDPNNPGELIEKRDAWASLECHELPPEYAGQTVALVPVPGGE